jgi:hypothetical protein
MEEASVGDPFAVLLLANTAVAEAAPLPHLTIETIELTVEHSIELPTTEAILANQVWCGTLLDFDELAICVGERTPVEKAFGLSGSVPAQLSGEQRDRRGYRDRIGLFRSGEECCTKACERVKLGSGSLG